MAEITQLLPAFPGFAVQYDPSKNPYFRVIMEENLRKLKQVSAGKSLLSSIQAATPAFRGSFPRGVNVMCVPTHLHFTQSGYNLEIEYAQDYSQKLTGLTPSNLAKHAPQGCPFWISGGSHNSALDQKSATNATGSVCHMRFTNVQVVTRRGEKAEPYVVLAHELIHSLHCLQGIKMDGRDEELWTTGLGKYENNPMSENVFRAQFGLAKRQRYF
ncbi:M91 family zinc metallopeptidase [Vibrio sp. ER1A]|uniref:M91 family zinc metallopeptidase n=1 Tax=Vibrio sp. ER1A TaxID=1517681 RepID=UPI0004DD2386|nr:M91 family zinc metallopeptidase [Vibrio sp. ER1A]KFA95881.1 hypothetical protein HW45_23005 [Vibrio sp. ER1A]